MIVLLMEDSVDGRKKEDGNAVMMVREEENEPENEGEEEDEEEDDAE